MKKLLLIEDNPEMRENTSEILTLAGYTVVTAENGKEGVKMAKHESPDLVICDIMMPELDGYGVLHMLGNDASTASIPFIFLTAKAEKADQRKGMNLGADDYLTKPFDDIELLHTVEMRLKKTDLMKKDFTRTAEGVSEFLENAQQSLSLSDLKAKHEARTYKKKAAIYHEGAYPHGAYFISKGKVKTYRANDDGKELITGLYKEGDFIGYTTLLEGGAYGDSAVALEDSEIMQIPVEEFFALMFSSRDVSRKFVRLLTDSIQEKEERLLKLAYNSVRKRVAESLLMLVDRYKKPEETGFSMALSREDLAGLVGTATETVIRTLSDFKDEGLVAVKGSMITILDQEKLMRMKN